ncbi:MAG: hypothetical protein H7099_17580, partial [Gemmatimonadaceae bacterium]|nr:hypothetical protein [Gemmatimonadaceae bacterium]
SVQLAEAAAQRAAERTARAEGRLEAAQLRYAQARATDTTSSPALLACDALALSCEEAKAAARIERDSLKKVITLKDRAIATKDSSAQAEPERARQQIARGIQQWRETHPQPSRVTAFSVGTLTGVAMTIAAVIGLR